MLHNQLLISAFAAWLLAQTLKFIIDTATNGKLDFRRLLGDGGMPSGHSAAVCALATSCGLICGFSSVDFATAALVAIIVMHDATGVRLESGKQAQAINEMLEWLRRNSFQSNIEHLKEVLGHTHLQVIFGAALGIAVAFGINILWI